MEFALSPIYELDDSNVRSQKVVYLPKRVKLNEYDYQKWVWRDTDAELT